MWYSLATIDCHELKRVTYIQSITGSHSLHGFKYTLEKQNATIKRDDIIIEDVTNEQT